MIAVEINNISFNYNQQQIFNDLCLTINNQEKVGIIGANGAGKTTLFFIYLWYFKT